MANCPNSNDIEMNNIFNIIDNSSKLNRNLGETPILPKQNWPSINIDLLFNREYSRAFFQNSDLDFRYSHNEKYYFTAALFSSTTSTSCPTQTDSFTYKNLKDTLYINNCAVIHLDHAFLLPMFSQIDFLIDNAVDSLVSSISSKILETSNHSFDQISESSHTLSPSQSFSSKISVPSNSIKSPQTTEFSQSINSNAPFTMPDFSLNFCFNSGITPQYYAPIRFFPKDLMPAFQLEYSRIVSKIIDYSLRHEDNYFIDRDCSIYQLLLLPKFYGDHINRSKTLLSLNCLIPTLIQNFVKNIKSIKQLNVLPFYQILVIFQRQ